MRYTEPALRSLRCIDNFCWNGSSADGGSGGGNTAQCMSGSAPSDGCTVGENNTGADCVYGASPSAACYNGGVANAGWQVCAHGGVADGYWNECAAGGGATNP